MPGQGQTVAAKNTAPPPARCPALFMFVFQSVPLASTSPLAPDISTQVSGDPSSCMSSLSISVQLIRVRYQRHKTKLPL